MRLNSRGDPILDRCPACEDELGRADKPQHFEEHDAADFGLEREAVPGVGLGADHSPNVVTDGGRICEECGEPATTRTDDGRLVCDDHDPSEDDPLLVTDGGGPLADHWQRCEIPDCRNRVPVSKAICDECHGPNRGDER